MTSTEIEIPETWMTTYGPLREQFFAGAIEEWRIEMLQSQPTSLLSHSRTCFQTFFCLSLYFLSKGFVKYEQVKISAKKERRFGDILIVYCMKCD